MVPPVHTLLLGPGEHRIGPVIRTSIGTIFAGDAFVRPDGFQDSLTAARPGIPFAAADAVGNDRLVGDVLLIPGSAAGTVMGRVLIGFPGQQAACGLVNTGAVPVRLAHHLLAPVGEMFIGEGSIDSFRHFRHLWKRNGRRLFAVTLVGRSLFVVQLRQDIPELVRDGQADVGSVLQQAQSFIAHVKADSRRQAWMSIRFLISMKQYTGDVA